MFIGVVIWKGVYEWGLILLWEAGRVAKRLLLCCSDVAVGLAQKDGGGEGLECRLLLKSIHKPTLKTISKVRVGIVQMLKELYGFCV